jgi:hypothetical protein
MTGASVSLHRTVLVELLPRADEAEHPRQSDAGTGLKSYDQLADKTTNRSID